MIRNLNKFALIFLIIFSIGCYSYEKKVTMKNLKEFKSTMESSLPIGSTKKQVEDYLNNLGLINTYVEDEKIFYSIVPNIGRYRVIYETSLLIRLRLDEGDKLKVIEYELEHAGL